jgi:hypothetical protein
MKLITKTRAAIAKKATAAGLTILLAAPMAGAGDLDDNFDGKDFGQQVRPDDAAHRNRGNQRFEPVAFSRGIVIRNAGLLQQWQSRVWPRL